MGDAHKTIGTLRPRAWGRGAKSKAQASGRRSKFDENFVRISVRLEVSIEAGRGHQSPYPRACSSSTTSSCTFCRFWLAAWTFSADAWQA